MIIDRDISIGQISLRSLSVEGNHSDYVSWLNDPQINRTLETRENKSEADIRDFIKVSNQNPSVLLLGIFAGEKHIGNIKADIIHSHKTAGIGLLLGDKNFHGQGIGSKVIQAFSDFIFSEYGIYKINAGIYETNIPSVRAFEKAGYKTEYIKRLHVINADGRREDVIMMVKYEDK